MARTSGARDIPVALLDGPVATRHPDLAGAAVRFLGPPVDGACASPHSAACAHGTFVAGILVARRGARAPAICPGCTLLVRPIFRATTASGALPSATPDEVAAAIVEAVGAGARVINLSAATGAPSTRLDRRMHDALDHAAGHGVIVVAAAGNRATLGSSSITRHPWVVPVTACDAAGRPVDTGTLGASIGRRGVAAPGDRIESLGPDGAPQVGGGTSAAAAFVTGAVALLWSLRPLARGADVRRAITHGDRRTSVTPPVLDAARALAALLNPSGPR
jgi:subtilisin family serine protease